MVSQDEESPQDEVSSQDKNRTKKHVAMGIIAGLLSSGALWAAVRAIAHGFAYHYGSSKEESTVQSVPPRPQSNITFLPPKPFDFEALERPKFPPSFYFLGIKDLSVDDVPFYYCPAEIQPPSKSLVLLHGYYNSTRDIWPENEIMQDFCSNGSLEVLAIELPFSPYHNQLKSLLESLEAGGYVSFPVALVTPSISSTPVTDWLANGDAQEMATYVDPWIPVAPVSLDTLDDQQVSSVVSEVLAIYGDEDSAGARTSQRLGILVDAETVELSGGHAVYNEKPEEFVDVVVGFLDVGSAMSTATATATTPGPSQTSSTTPAI